MGIISGLDVEKEGRVCVSGFSGDCTVIISVTIVLSLRGSKVPVGIYVGRRKADLNIVLVAAVRVFEHHQLQLIVVSSGYDPSIIMVPTDTTRATSRQGSGDILFFLAPIRVVLDLDAQKPKFVCSYAYDACIVVRKGEGKT